MLRKTHFHQKKKEIYTFNDITQTESKKPDTHTITTNQQHQDSEHRERHNKLDNAIAYFLHVPRIHITDPLDHLFFQPHTIGKSYNIIQ